MSAQPGTPLPSLASWQSHVVHLIIRSYMRPHVLKPIDPLWVRRRMGRQHVPRLWMVRSTGAQVAQAPATGTWPGGERVSWPDANASAPVLLYLHGGGYLAGSPATHRPLVASLVRRLRGTAFVPAYRLAPEHPYPAALHDARAAYLHLLSQGIAPTRIVIAGDSAGGGLALAITLALRDEQIPLPAAVVAFSPWTDLAATGRSIEENTDRCAMFAGVTIKNASQFYLGTSDPMLPYISPLYGDYHGMPPLLVHASEDEVLRDDAVRVAERARSAGVDVELRLWRRVPHAWQFFPAVLPEAAESLKDTVRFITKRTEG
ncbi:MAG: alpha/beta hydrolase [Gemmatimonas sp.]